TEVLTAVVEAQVVAAGPAHAAVAAARMARARDTDPRREPVADRDLAGFHHLTRPLVAWDERVGPRPPALEGSLDDLRVGAADRDGVHAGQDLVRSWTWDRDVVADRELVRSGEHQGLHRRGLRRCHGSDGAHAWNATTRPM